MCPPLPPFLTPPLPPTPLLTLVGIRLDRVEEISGPDSTDLSARSSESGWPGEAPWWSEALLLSIRYLVNSDIVGLCDGKTYDLIEAALGQQEPST